MAQVGTVFLGRYQNQGRVYTQQSNPLFQSLTPKKYFGGHQLEDLLMFRWINMSLEDSTKDLTLREAKHFHGCILCQLPQQWTFPLTCESHTK